MQRRISSRSPFLLFPPQGWRPVPPLKIPRSAWHSVVQRAAQGESLRSIARSLDTSYEAVRRVLLAARQELQGDPEEPPPLSDEDVG